MMEKRVIRLTESDVHRIVMETVKDVLAEARNVRRIRITALADMGRNKERIMNDVLKLRHARNVGDEESVNHFVLGTLQRYPDWIEFEIVD